MNGRGTADGRRQGLGRRGRSGLASLLLFVLLGVVWPAVGAAQRGKPRRVKLSRLQERLLKDALQESSKASPNFRAVEINFQAALQKGEVDLLYAGLGRALFNQRRCGEAEAAYQKALGAPNSTLVSREDLQAQIEVDRAAMLKECPGEVRVECSPLALQVSVEGQEVACGGALELSPGTRLVQWRLGMLSGEQRVQVVGTQTSLVKLAVSPDSSALVIRCKPGDMRVWIDEREVLCDVPQQVKPGRYRLRGQWRRLSTRHSVDVEPGEEKVVALQINKPGGATGEPRAPVVSHAPEPVARASPAASLEEDSGVSWWGWTLLGGGLALVGTGSAWSLGALNLQEAYVSDTLNDDVVSYAFYGAGGALLLGSLLVFAWDDEPTKPQAAARVWWGEQGAGLVLEGGW